MVAGVEQVDFGIRQIALERLRTGTDVRGIVPPQTTKIRGLYSRNHACRAVGYTPVVRAAIKAASGRVLATPEGLTVTLVGEPPKRVAHDIKKAQRHGSANTV
jgi:hypothetical protein